MQRDYDNGLTYSQIQQKYGIGSSTIQRASMKGLFKRTRNFDEINKVSGTNRSKRHDWNAIQNSITAGVSNNEIVIKFNISTSTLYKAIKNQLLKKINTSIYYFAKNRKYRSKEYNWSLINNDLKQGFTKSECIEKYNISNSNWRWVVQNNLISRSSNKLTPVKFERRGRQFPSSLSSPYLKKWLIKHGYLRKECSGCGQLPMWQGRPLTLELDHINGDNRDNRLENLRILCPNCHTQTPTWGRKRWVKSSG